MAGPHEHDDEPKKSKTKAKAKSKAKTKVEVDWKSPEAREAYVKEMAKKGATLPKGFIKDAKANTGH